MVNEGKEGGGFDENPIKTLKLTGKINQLLVCVRLKY